LAKAAAGREVDVHVKIDTVCIGRAFTPPHPKSREGFVDR